MPQLGSLRKRADQIEGYQNNLAINLSDTSVVDAKVADVRTLLEMKAEKADVNVIGDVIGNVREDLHSMRRALPDKDVTDTIKSIKVEVQKKADKRAVEVLNKKMKEMKGDEVNPAITNRCLSCDRPLAEAPTGEQIGQLALAINKTAYETQKLLAGGGGYTGNWRPQSATPTHTLGR